MPNWKKVIVSGSAAELTTLKITGTSGQSSEATSLMINSSGVVGTRELGSNAFNSNTYNNYSLPLGSSSTRGGFKIGYTESGKNYPVEISSEKMYVNVPWTDNNTTYSVGDGGLTQKNFTSTLKTKLDGIATSANNYTHPTFNGDDFSVDTGPLTGATVVSDIDINVTTDGNGHVTDANGSVSTRTLTLANLGYTGATNANYITNNNQLSNGAGYTTNVGDITGVTAGTGLSGGSNSGTATLNSVYLPAVDDRDMKPNTSGVGSSVKGIKPFFTSLGGMTGTANTDYQDALVLDTYSDSSGGNANCIIFDKNAFVIKHYNAASTATTWGTPKTIAYTSDIITNNNQISNGAGYITSFTNTVDMGDGFKIANSGGTDQFTVTENEEIRFAGSGATSVAFDSSTQKVTISSTNTTYSVGDGGLTQKNFTTTLKSKLDGIASSANNYTHPTFNGDDFSVDTGALTGATIVSDIDINVTTDGQGHVTDANGSVATRTLTLANLGYTGATDATNNTGTMSSWIIKEGNGTESTTVTNGETVTIEDGTGIQSELTSTSSGGTITITNTAPAGTTHLNSNTTKSDVGLSNVANESRATILAGNLTGTINSVAVATVTAGAAAGATANQDSTSTIRSGTTKANVGLGNVANESRATILASAALTGTPTAPTATANTNTTQIATTAYVQTEITDLIGGAPGTLNTLNELAAAIDDDASYASTLTTALGTKLPKSGGTMSGAINMNNSNITGVNALTFADPGPNEGLSWSGGNMKLYESPNDLTTNTAGNLQFVYGSTRRLTVNSTGIDVNGNIGVSGTVDGRDLASDGTKLDGIASSANNYSHPTYSGDDFSVDTGVLSGATVIKKIDINVTTDGQGHVTDTNGVVTTRTLTLANLGYTGATNANYITNNNQLTNGAGYITSFTNTVDMGDGFKIANSGGTDQFTVTENEEIRFAGSGATSVSFDSSTQKVTISSTDTNTVYTHPTHPGDDINVDTGALTGATVISDLDFNITTDTSGHVTDANGSVSTRTLTLANLGYTGETNATADQTASEILTLIKTVDGGGSGLDADTLDGLDLGGTRANVANKVVRTDGSGYANFGWINTTSGNTTSTITDIYVNTNDGYIRKATKAEFQSQMGIQTLTSNTDVDTGTETVITVSDSNISGYFFDYVVSNGANLRAGTVTAVEFEGTVEFNETSTADIGDTSDLTLLVQSDGTNIKLMATATSDNWSVKTIARLI